MGSIDRTASGMSLQSVSTANLPARHTFEPPRKRLRATPSWVEAATTLQGLLAAALPDKAVFHKTWLEALAAPAVCVTTVDDVQRLDLDDIAGLPVPPLVKGVFRDVITRASTRSREQQVILEATTARKKAFLGLLRDRNMQPIMAGSKYFQDAKQYRLILAREEIEAGVRLCAHRIETWAKGERIVLVGILKGAFMFVADLCKALIRPYSVYFVEASSYQNARTQGGLQISVELSEAKFFDATTRSPHKVVLIDELLDNGKTMHEMKQLILSKLADTHKENDILTCCLFSKKREKVYPEADITGIPNLPDLWLVGYGLDDRGTKRGWTELFAMPKVKIVETIEKEEVDKLVALLDDSATLTEPINFAGFELPSNHKQKYRVIGLDAHGAHARPCLQTPEGAKVRSKADLEATLHGLATVKGKYEQDLHFAFIQENLSLVPEDEIFSGNNQAYAELRCRLRKQLVAATSRFGLTGPADLETEAE
eukprot:CAMPEP_0117490032 /NCGR_PEP_ID=MMETSP0784-20121206/17343_1 /TAXON_ID=39447 /ORGANISM="" /LENGTH=483 /DNA_ID=CAMNT_0005284781 /DNA_START=90 /DNA_END=1541 /DNA_ORIENTATION=+